MKCPTCLIEPASFNSGQCPCCGRYFDDEWHNTFQAKLYSIGLTLSGKRKLYFNKEKEQEFINYISLPLKEQFIDLMNDAHDFSIRNVIIQMGVENNICDKEGKLL